jgi:Secretion system C-terminal sorting domain/PKD-like domain
MKMKVHTLFLFIGIFLHQAISFSKSPDSKLAQKLSESKGATTLYIENKGQIGDQHGQPNREVKFLILRPGLNIQLKTNSFSYDAYTVERFKRAERLEEPFPSKMDKQNDDSLVYHFSRVDIELVDANPNPQITQEGASSDYLNYYTHITSQTQGEAGVTGVRGYSNIVYHDIYPNIDLEWFLDKDGKPEYQFIINPGGDPSRIRLKYHGAQKIELISEAIHIHIKPGILKEHIPLSYLKESKEKLQIVFTKVADNEYGFNTPTYASNETLIIDPMPNRLWGTYYGGSDDDYGNSITVDYEKNVINAGSTKSVNTIASLGSYQNTIGGIQDAFVAKLSNQGKRHWATYFGGEGFDIARDLVTNASGNMIITGETSSLNSISTNGAFQKTYAGGESDIFIVQFASNGNRLWSTYYGGTGYEIGWAISIDKNQCTWITGETNSNNGISSTGAYQTKHGGYDDIFLLKIKNDGSKEWSTYYGFDGEDRGWDIEVDNEGNAWITGVTSTQFKLATPGAYQTRQAGGGDAFLAKFSSTGELIWSTYFGGSKVDYGWGLTIDNAGNGWVVGYTASSDTISSSNAFQKYYGGGNYDCFVAKFTASGVKNYGSYIGGSNDEYAWKIIRDSVNNLWILGQTNSSTVFATSSSFQSKLNGSNDGFIYRISPDGLKLQSTYYGGPSNDLITGGSALDSSTVIITGYTGSSSDISTNKSFQEKRVGGYDSFISKFTSEEYGINTITFNSSMCMQQSYTVNYNLVGKFEIDNTFIIQLSDKDGSFIKPITLRIDSTLSSRLSPIVIPNNIPISNKYRIRVISTRPEIIGEDNGNDISINPSPLSVISGSNRPCILNKPDRYSVSLQSGISYQWISPSRGSIIGSDRNNTVDIVWTAPGVDSVRLRTTYTSTGCFSDTSFIVTINPAPSPYISGERALCVSPTTVEYSVKSGATFQYSWRQPKLGMIVGLSDANTVKIRWNATGSDTLFVRETNTTSGCSKDTFIVVTILSQPQPTISGNSEVLEQEKGLVYSVQLENGSSYEWSIVSGDATITTKSGQLVVVNVGAKGSVILKVVQTNKDGCVNEAQFVITVKSPSGVNGEAQSLFSIYPNPIGESNQVLIDFTETLHQDISIELLDILGTVHYSNIIQSGSESCTIPIQGLSSGMYVIRLRMDNQVFIEKLIVN